MKSTSEKEAPGEAEPSPSEEEEFTKEELSDKEAEQLLEEEEEPEEEAEEERGPTLRERIRAADIRSRLSVAAPFKTGLILLCVFLVALFLRGYFGYGPATAHGVPYLYSGGSDSFYHQRAIEYGLDEHRHLRFDTLLNYPLGFPNPRPPFFDYATVVFGEMLAPVFFGGDALMAASFVLIWITALFGALTVFPVYALAREAFNRRVGLIAALLLAITPAHIERSVITNADHDSTAIFFVVVCFYFLLRALRFMKVEKWVGSWHRPSEIVSGVGRMVRENRKSSIYAMLSGVAFAMVALTWQGYPYVLAVIVFYFFITLLVDKFRAVDPLSVTFIIGLALFTGFIVAYPYYYFWGFVGQWYDTPFLIFLIAMAVGFAFCATRDYPWLFVFPAGVLVGIAAFFALSYVNPGFQNAVVSGQGYFFLRSKLYTTIAEAQPAQFSRMAVSFGMGAFLLALWGVAHVAVSYRKKPRHDYLFVVAFAVVGTAFTISQGRFLTNGAPIIAILAAFVIDKVMDIAKFEEIRTSYSSMRGTKVRAAVKSVKFKHALLGPALAVLVVLPSLWYAVDAGIPNEEKRQWDLQVYKAMPDVDLEWPGIIDAKLTLRPGTYDQENGSFHYFGAFGYSLPLPNQYYSDGYRWLSEQDSQILDESKRPAFISWWDYGFEAANRGKHPTVADNFQNGYQLAGSFLMAQNDSEAMSLLVSRLLEGAYTKEGKLNPKVASALERRGISVQKIEDILRNPASYVSIVLANPDRYGNFSQDLTTFNAKYAAMREEIMGKAKDDALHDLWRELRSLTGWDVKYFAVDSRLMVFGGQETGIFYAPAKLADKRMKGADLTMPYDFFEIKAVSDVGTEYDPDDVPPGVNLNQQNPYKIAYKRPFFNSMLYRAFVGYGPQHVNRTETNPGIPGVQGSGDMGSLEPKQAFMMKHWRVGYKTAYWNPYDEKNVSKHTRDWAAVDWHVAQDRIKAKNGTVIQGQADTSLWRQNGGVVILRYYDGAILEGIVKTSSGRIVAGARVTATDEQNVPHDSVVSGKDGQFRLILPFGNITVTASAGGSVDQLTQNEKTELGKMTLNVTLDEADRRTIDLNRDGVLDWQITKDLVVKEATIKGRIFLDTDLSGSYASGDTLLKDHEFTVTGAGTTVTASTDSVGDYRVPRLSPGQHDFSLEYNGRRVEEKSFATVGPGETSSKDWLVKVGSVKGNLSGLPSGRGLQMRLVGDGRTITTPIGQNGTNGTFEFRDLNPGIYTVQVDSDEFTVGVKRATVALGSATSVNLQVQAGVPLKVRARAQTSDGKVPAAFAQLALDRHETFPPSGRSGEGPVPVQLDANGEANLVVPASTYSIAGQFSRRGVQYAGAAVAEAYGVGGASVELDMSEAIEVRGRLVLGDSREAGQNVRVAFYSETGGRASALTNGTGHYRAWLPKGSYTVVVQEDRLTAGYAYLDDVSLGASVELPDILAQNASIVHGFTYDDLNSNSALDPGEERGGVRLVVRTAGLEFDVFSTAANGSYKVFLPKELPAEAEVGGFGWVTTHASLVKGNLDIAVSETKAKVAGDVRYRGQVVPGELAFSFTRTYGSGNNTTTEVVRLKATDGVLAGELSPGSWEMELSQPINGVARWQAAGDIEVKHGTAEVKVDAQISKLVNLSVSSDAKGQEVALRLTGPQQYISNLTDQGVLEVEAGNYTAEASTSTKRLAFARVDVDEFRSNLSLSLLPSARLFGKVAAPEPGSGVKIRLEEATSGWAGTVETKAGGEYEVRLIAAREYLVTVDHIMNETIADTPVPVLLRFEAKVFLGADKELPIDAHKTRLEVRVAGRATDLFGNPASGARVFLRNAVLGQAVEQRALADGRFEYTVPPGTYNLYATHSSQGVPQSLLQQVVVPAVKDHPLPIQTLYSASISGRVEFKQSAFNANLRVSGNAAVWEMPAPGTFSVLLPVGEYTATAETSLPEYGMPVSYTASAQVSLKENTYHVFDLKRADVMTAKLDWDKSQKQSLRQGQRLATAYILALENTGNIVDTWRFSSTLSEWNMTFSPARVTLQPGTGQRTAQVYASFQAPANARVDHPALVAEAKSETGKQTVAATLEVDIVQVHGVALRVTATEFAGSEGRVTLRLENKGNGDDAYTLTVLNDQELLSGGWAAGFREGNDTKRSTSRAVTASEGGADVVLHLKPTGAAKKSVAILVEAASERGGVDVRVSVPLSLPDLTSAEVKVEGPEAKEAPFDWLTPWYPVIYLAVIIPTSFVVVYFFQRHGLRGLAAIIKWRVRKNLLGPRMRR